MKYFVTILALVLLSRTSTAQITITDQDLLGALPGGTTISESFTSDDTTGLRQLEMLSGPGVTWDFTGRTYHSVSDTSTLYLRTYPGGAPLADDPAFTGSTHVLVVPPSNPGDPTSYEFLTVNSGGMWVNGVSQDSAGTISKVLTFSPALQLYKLPLAYQASWHSGSAIVTDGLPPGVSFRDSVDAVVDGYGQLVTPSGTFQVLRLNQKQLSILSYPPFLNSVATNYQFDWMSKDGAHAMISADSALRPNTGQSNGTPGIASSSGATYSVASQSAVHSLTADHQPVLRLSQNPASSSTTEMYYTLDKAGAVDLTLIDASGNIIRTLQSGHVSAGRNAIDIDPKSLQPGAYFIHLSAPSVNATEKLVIVR